MTESGPRNGVADELAERAALARARMDAGDFRSARRLARDVLEQCRAAGREESEPARTARLVLEATGPDRLALVLGFAVLVTGLVFWVQHC